MNQKKSSSIFMLFLGLIMVFTMGECSRGPIPNTTNNAHDYDHATITMDRSTCFGTCPSYTLNITGDGKVVYEGRQFVAIKGEQTAEISKENFRMLVDQCFKIGYFEMEDRYDTDISDVPETETSLQIDGKTKKILNRAEGPKDLDDWQNLIDKTVNSEQWINGLPEK